MVDTGPLFKYFGWLYLDSIHADKATRDQALSDEKSGLIWDLNKQERFQQFLNRCPRRITSNHFAVEILNFRKHSPIEGHEPKFREFVLKHYNFIEEHAVFVKDLDRELVVQLGPTDAGLVWIARTVGGNLITSDDRLFRTLDSDLYKITRLDHLVE